MRVLYAHCGQVLAARGRFSNLMINRLTLNQVGQRRRDSIRVSSEPLITLGGVVRHGLDRKTPNVLCVFRGVVLKQFCSRNGLGGNLEKKSIFL